MIGLQKQDSVKDNVKKIVSKGLDILQSVLQLLFCDYLIVSIENGISVPRFTFWWLYIVINTIIGGVVGYKISK